MQDPVLYVEEDDGGVLEIPLPTKWAICDTCEGEGRSSAYLGAFTSSEWAEQDEEFKEDYMAGKYDRPCDSCGGRGSVKIVDYDKLTDEQKVLYDKQMEEEARYNAMVRAEREMGA